jgi:hypothetical protein
MDDRISFGMWVHFGLAVAFGLFGFWLVSDDPNPKVPLLNGMIFGFGGSWLAVFCYVWARHGWKAARTMSFTP